jgi:hypothetical protein
VSGMILFDVWFSNCRSERYFVIKMTGYFCVNAHTKKMNFVTAFFQPLNCVSCFLQYLTFCYIVYIYKC